jgi:hypothetical protein
MRGRIRQNKLQMLSLEKEWEEAIKVLFSIIVVYENGKLSVLTKIVFKF